jgi:autotransporter-associated beta strand protein
MKSRHLRFSALSSILFAASVHAAQQVYDATNPAGVWDTSTLNWDASTVAWTNGNNALFDAGTGTVTVSPGVSLGELVVTSTTESTIGGIATSVYRFNGGSLDFGGTLGVLDTVGTGLRNSQINSKLLGTAALEVYATGGDSGQGRLVLGGDNSGLTGGITVKSGLLAFTAPLAAGSNEITLDGGGLFGPVNHSGTGGTIVNGPTDLVLGNPIVLTGVANRLRVWGSRNLIVTGSLTGAGDLRKVDGGTLVLGKVPEFTGSATVFQGALVTPGIQDLGTGTIAIGGSGQPTLGYWGAGESTDRVVSFSTGSGGIITSHSPAGVQFTSDMTGTNAAMGLVFNGGGVGALNGVATGALVNFNKQGIGTWTVNGTLNLAGGELRSQGGILAMGATSATAANANLTRANNGVIRFTTGANVLTGTASTNGILGGWATFDNTTWAKTNGAGNPVDAFSAFTNDTWGTTENTSVTLAGADPAADSTTHSLRFNEAGARTLTLTGTNTIASGGLMVTANVDANATAITGGTLRGANGTDLAIHQFNPAGTLTIGSVIANNTAATGLTKTGTGALVLTGANTYTGTTRVFEGKLTVNANSGGKVYEVAANSTLELGYSTGASVYGYGVTVNGAGTTASTGVYLKGGSTYTLQGALRLSGLPTTVRSFDAGNAILAGWDNNGTHLIVEPTASGSVIASGVQFAPGGYGYVMNIAAGVNTLTGDLTFEGPLTGAANANGTHFRKVGFGSLRITGAGTNTAPLQVRQGTAVLSGGDNRLGAGSSVRLGEGADSGLLVLDGINQTLTALTNAGTGTDNRVAGGSATVSNLTINNAGDTTIAAALGGSALNQNNLALAKSGIGTLTLSGANTFVGDTTTSAGTLRLDYSVNDNSKLSDTGTLTLGGNLILDGGSHEEIVGGTVVTAASSVTRPSGAAVIQLGQLSRTGTATLNLAAASIAKTTTPNEPSGSLPAWISIDGLPAANDGAGNIVVYVPTFTDVFRLGGALPNNPAASVRIVDGGFGGAVTPAAPGVSEIQSLTQAATAGPVTIALGDSDTLRLVGEIGTITAAPGAGALTIQGGLLSSGATLDTPGTLAVTGEAVVTIASTLSDNGTGPLAVVKSGPGTLTLTAMNNHTGGVTLNAGQLGLGGPFCFGLGGTFTINGGTIDNVTGDALTISDLLPQVWGGNFTFLGSHDLAFQSGGVNLTGNREVTVAAATLDIQGPVSGTAGFTKLGAGTLLFSGTGNSWTGTTNVSGGVLEVRSRTTDGPFVVNQGTTLRLGYTTPTGGYAATNLKLHGDGVAATTGLYLRGGTSYNASGSIELLTAPTTIRHYGDGLAAIGMFDINGNAINVSAAASGSVIDANIELVSRGYGMSMIVAAGAETATGDLVVNGPLNAANGGFYKRGTGSVRLNGVATAGNVAVQIQGGRVISGVANALGVNANLPISAGAILDLNGFDQEAASLSGAGAVLNGGAAAATLKINQTADATFTGVLGGATPAENNFAFVKSGTAALTLNGLNTYTGDTTLAQGTLTLGQPVLADAAAVRVTTGTTLALPHGQADTVNALFIDGVQQPAGTYTSSNAAFISGSGSLVVTTGSVSDPFAAWATAKGLDGSPGKEAGFGDDPDRDGVDNGLEWILGGEPLDGKSGGLVKATATAAGGLTLTFTRNDDSVGQAALVVEYNGTLGAPWNTATIGETNSGPDANGVTVAIDTATNPDAVTVTIPAANAVAGKLFARLKATKP